MSTSPRSSFRAAWNRSGLSRYFCLIRRALTRIRRLGSSRPFLRSDSDPILESEYLFRRIPAWLDWVNLEAGTVSPQAFAATPKDTDGLSFYRQCCVDPKTVAHPEHKPGQYYVARISAEGLISLGLSLVPRPMPPIPGHTIVPELRWKAHGGDSEIRNRLGEIRDTLSIWAAVDIVFTPTETPPASDASTSYPQQT